MPETLSPGQEEQGAAGKPELPTDIDTLAESIESIKEQVEHAKRDGDKQAESRLEFDLLVYQAQLQDRLDAEAVDKEHNVE